MPLICSHGPAWTGARFQIRFLTTPQTTGWLCHHLWRCNRDSNRSLQILKQAGGIGDQTYHWLWLPLQPWSCARNCSLWVCLRAISSAKRRGTSTWPFWELICEKRKRHRKENPLCQKNIYSLILSFTGHYQRQPNHNSNCSMMNMPSLFHSPPTASLFGGQLLFLNLTGHCSPVEWKTATEPHFLLTHFPTTLPSWTRRKSMPC